MSILQNVGIMLPPIAFAVNRFLPINFILFPVRQILSLSILPLRLAYLVRNTLGTSSRDRHMIGVRGDSELIVSMGFKWTEPRSPSLSPLLTSGTSMTSALARARGYIRRIISTVRFGLPSVSGKALVSRLRI